MVERSQLNGVARARFDALSVRIYSADVTEAELEELDRLQEAHPDWEAEEAAIIARPPVSEVEPPAIPRRAETFTSDEIARIARSQRCPPAALRQCWIVQRNNSFYVIGLEGEYRPPISRCELAVSLPRDLARVPSVSPSATEVPDGYIQWDKKNGESTARKSVDEMLTDYAVVARRSVASMAIRHSFYNPVTEIFYERVCPLRRDLTPAYSKEVERWLTLLGGEDAGKLNDWVATVSRLERPTCAIYLHGPKDSGKNLFATGIARLWGEAPTELRSAHGSFNDAIVDNPLIFADEELPKGVTSGFIRSFVGQGTHPLRRKNIPEAKLLGYFRLVMAANNADLLKFEDESFSPDDIDAIAARILYIKCSLDAAVYLKSLGGREGTAAWVDGDVIARHALWLRDNRKVVLGDRFLVTGPVRDVHRRVATHGNVRGLVIEWICKAMFEKRKFTSKTPGLRFGGGKVYVNASYVKETWEEVLGDSRMPSLKKIGQALKPLARGEKRLLLDGRRADFYDVDPAHIYDTCGDLQIGTIEDYKSLVETPDLRLVEDAEVAASAAVIPIQKTGLFSAKNG